MPFHKINPEKKIEKAIKKNPELKEWIEKADKEYIDKKINKCAEEIVSQTELELMFETEEAALKEVKKIIQKYFI